MWLYVLIVAAVAFALVLLRRRRPPIVLTPEEREQMKLLPLPTVKWTSDEWDKWQRLLDAGLVAITGIQSDFTVSCVLVITDTGEQALDV